VAVQEVEVDYSIDPRNMEPRVRRTCCHNNCDLVGSRCFRSRSRLRHNNCYHRRRSAQHPCGMHVSPSEQQWPNLQNTGQHFSPGHQHSATRHSPNHA
jgi:hypothetical protein